MRGWVLLGSVACSGPPPSAPAAVPEAPPSAESTVGETDGTDGEAGQPSPYEQELVQDGSFEDLEGGAWLVSGSCRSLDATGVLAPADGERFLAGSTGRDPGDCRVSQVLDLVALGVSEAAVDAGTVAVEVEGWLANEGPQGPFDDQVFLEVANLGPTGEPISTLETRIGGTRDWVLRGATGLLPPATRQLQVSVVSRYRNPPDNHSFADAVSLRLREVEPVSPALTLQPLLQDYRTEALRLSWETDGNLAVPGLAWGPAGESVREQSHAVRSIVVDDSHVVHVAEATDLEAATAYDYEVSNGQTVSETWTFRTAPLEDAASVRIGWLADNQEGAERFATHLSHLAPREPDLFFVAGDMVSDPTRLSEWREFWWGPLVDTADFGSQTPVLVARGNHDLHHPYAYAYVQVPGGGVQYSFRYGPVFVVVLDSQILPNGLPDHVDQERFLAEQLQTEAARSAQFRVVTFHQGPFTNSSGNGTNGNVGAREVWVPLMEAGGVDLVITGHYHGYQRGTAPSGITYVTVGGGGSTLLEDTYPFWDFLDEVVLTWQYSVMDVEGDTLTFTTHDLDDAVIDRFTLRGGAR